MPTFTGGKRFLTKFQISKFSYKKKEGLVNWAPIPLAAMTGPLALSPAHSSGPPGAFEFETPIYIPATLPDGKRLNEGNKSGLLSQLPTVEAVLNGYLFHIFIFQQFLKLLILFD